MSHVMLTLRVFASILLIGMFMSGVASAHEHRQVGRYEFVVGFQNEPAYVGEPNGIWIQVTEAKNQGDQSNNQESDEHEETGKPVEGLEKTLKAEVIQGSSRMQVPLSPAWNQPGVYIGNFIPTVAGDYKFHFTGSINGQNIDETFESGPNRFSPVEDVTAIQFPIKTGSPEQISLELEQARSTANQSRILGVAGVVIGAIGLAVGLVALAGRRRYSKI